MPGIQTVRRKSGPSRSRNSQNPKILGFVSDDVSSEPPPKKRRYIPGGPGGGGRYVDVDGTEIPVGGTGPGGYAYVGPRGRVGRENAANGVQPPTPATLQRPRRESRRERPPARPRYSSAAAAAAAVVQGDGFKPREERSWEEFHQDLNIEIKFSVLTAEDVDGNTKATDATTPFTNGVNAATHHRIPFSHNEQAEAVSGALTDGALQSTHTGTSVQPETPPMTKRRPGRPPRRPDAMLKGIGTPDMPKKVPIPGPNPREKLTLPKPSFRRVDPFDRYEVGLSGQMNYVDRSMAAVGYQESDVYHRDEKRLIRVMDGLVEEDLDLVKDPKGDIDEDGVIGGQGVGRVEYDMDEQDQKWLEEYNTRRKAEQVEAIKPAIFEITMTKLEKEWHALEKRIPKPNPKPPQTHRPRSSSAAAVNGEPVVAGEEQDSKCAICDDGDCENTNAIVFCDGCDLAVHQECYGVPFIPEGQWLCRKCQLIGRGTPTCIFCPNMEGAFKQTNSSKWSHLLCAIWIPEVTLGNPTFMEPVMDVEKVPKPRWKLTCYICKQRMGACIQCSNKNCYLAFHVTCARRAKLFLQMKSSSGSATNLDPTHLKAFCDKHVSTEWRKDNNTDYATQEAVDFYAREFKEVNWTNAHDPSLNLALSGQGQQLIDGGIDDNQPKIHLIVGGNTKRKRNQPPRAVWKLPSGAPVIPSVVYDSVENSLQRFTVRKRRDFASDMCRYWTLKREAKRGAALLKRLQLSMETFSSMEVTRRNFAGMGAAGRVRLERRIGFADQLLQEMEQLKGITQLVKEREMEKLKDAEILRSLIDTIYFPIPPLLLPIIDKAQALDGKKATFQDGLAKIRANTESRFYTSVSTFSSDLYAVFVAITGTSTLDDQQEDELPLCSDGRKKTLTPEQKDKRKLARRIIKAVKPALEDAVRKESELCNKPYEQQLKLMDMLSISSRRDSAAESLSHEHIIAESNIHHESLRTMIINNIQEAQVNGLDHTEQPEIRELSETAEPHSTPSKPPLEAENTKKTSIIVNGFPPPEARTLAAFMANGTLPPSGEEVSVLMVGHLAEEPAVLVEEPVQPSPLAISLPSATNLQVVTSLSVGGIPWYMTPFDPKGTTVFEERWTGRDVAGEMSEELSEVDEEELDEMDIINGDIAEEHDTEAVHINGTEGENLDIVTTRGGRGKEKERTKKGRVKKRWRGFR
ncbi:nuA3 HAT complex component nto1 [Agyrium rufum]|nr:nuA3 HAT complex component nto1 [Agyrium rufum]